ncbi:MAG: LysR substrate-binding domain-containing protein [Verrucomicrobiales bacterium]|nr:LysR substrate-binding domain-containing protein [Verrucomicrobiales bacterium]
MDIRHLRYFQAVAEELSFSKAAPRLHVAQPALSRAVKELEDDLGVLLLFRSRRSVSLTPAGSVLLHEIGLLLQRLDETVRRVQRTAAGEEGELRLGYIGPPTQMFLGRILKNFRQHHPRVSLVLEERTPERVWEMVARGRLALGITRPVLAHRALRLPTLLLRKEPLVCAFPANHRFVHQTQVLWRELADEPLVILSRREGVGLHDAILAACRRARVTPKLAHTPSLVSTVFSYVEAGAGIGVVTDSVCSLGDDGPLLFRPLKPAHTVDLVMVWSDRDDSPAAAAFRDLVKQWLGAGKLWPRRKMRGRETLRKDRV